MDSKRFSQYLLIRIKSLLGQGSVQNVYLFTYKTFVVLISECVQSGPCLKMLRKKVYWVLKIRCRMQE